jgi:hypothetical protein
MVTGIDLVSGGSSGAAGLFGIDGKQLAGGLVSIAGLAGAYDVKPKPAPAPQPEQEKEAA